MKSTSLNSLICVAPPPAPVLPIGPCGPTPPDALAVTDDDETAAVTLDALAVAVIGELVTVAVMLTPSPPVVPLEPSS